MKERIDPESLAQLQEKGYIDLNGNLLGRGFLDSALQISPLQEAQRYDGKVLIVHGTADQSVPVSEAKEYAAAFAKCQPRLHIIADANHTFNSQKWETELIKTTVEWMKENLNAGPVLPANN